MPRGLGRGLGALIPTAPPAPPPAAPSSAPSAGQLRTDGSAALAPEPSRAPDAVDRWLLRGPAEDLAGGVPRGTPGDPRPGEPATDDGTADRSGVGVLRELPLDAVEPNPRQPRVVFDPDALAELVASVREVGVLQPLVVRPLPGSDRFGLVMGERRWRAAREAGLSTVPAVVRETGDRDLLRDALLENLHRADLNPLEEAAAYEQLISDAGCTQEELAARIGRSRPQISNTLRLLRLTPPVQRRVAAGVLSAGHARALLSLPDPAAQETLASRVVAEGLSVRTTEEIAAAGAESAPRRSRPRAATAGAPEHDELAQRLGDRLDTRVTVSASRSRGRIVIDFATTGDLRRIADLIAGGTPPAG